ncbi:hypothetical protein H5P28_14455 [Ruficoccus amylovorans]|uniref:Hemerythrin-like domain-containing protein n=1 Tax=Ruficoccus amylovorans TaxID=1804625 RepID=A0A842HFN2_9BACT|nr:hypothetical protein [Ruficoccus amylovorans]MBC2595465.1 hypothetical protein [Ruficoccus amylovorans]
MLRRPGARWSRFHDALADLEQNMHQHVHTENNVLFPKALRREAELTSSTLA